MQALLRPPADPSTALDAGHLAERFGLFMIILLGEIVVSVGGAAIETPGRTSRYWAGLVAGLVLAAALWWAYFTVAAEINEHVLRVSGGNPALAYGLYAAGHIPPAFGLLSVAAGVALSLVDDPPRAVPWLVAGGMALFLAGSRAIVVFGRRRGRLLQPLVLAGTVCLGLLGRWLGASGLLVVAAAWAVGVGALASLQGPAFLRRIIEDPMELFRSR